MTGDARWVGRSLLPQTIPHAPAHWTKSARWDSGLSDGRAACRGWVNRSLATIACNVAAKPTGGAAETSKAETEDIVSFRYVPASARTVLGGGF
jgi:hypothetical protein